MKKEAQLEEERKQEEIDLENQEDSEKDEKTKEEGED